MAIKVSVVVPIYKIPDFALKGCVNSLLEQNYKNCEIILVDDGSPDDCGKICDKFAEKDKRIKVIHKNNAGVSEARNTGIQVSTGDYIMFVDGDDCLHPSAVSMMIKEAQQYSLDIVLCDYKRFFTDSPNYDKIETGGISCLVFDTKQDVISLRRKCLHEDNVLGVRFNGAPWGKLYTSKIIKDCGFKFDSSLVRSQDNHFNFRVFGTAHKIGYINEKLYYYRQLQESSVNRYRENLYEISNLYIDRITSEINETNDRSSYMETLLHVKIEKMLELCSNYSRSPKDEVKQAVSYIRIARNKWLSDLKPYHLFGMELNGLEKIRIFFVLKGCYKFSLIISDYIRKVKLKLAKYRK